MFIYPSRLLLERGRWTILLESRAFLCIKSNKTGFISSLIEKVYSAFDVFDTDYKIVMRQRDYQKVGAVWTVCVSETDEGIKADWEVLKHILEQGAELTEFEDLRIFLASKIGTLIDTSRDDKKRRDRQFQQIFNLDQREKLHGYYFCSLELKNSAPGWLYISHSFIGFYSFVLGKETKRLFSTSEIVEVIKKKRSSVFFANSLKIRFSSGESISLTNILKEDLVYKDLDDLWDGLVIGLERILTEKLDDDTVDKVFVPETYIPEKVKIISLNKGTLWMKGCEKGILVEILMTDKYLAMGDGKRRTVVAYWTVKEVQKVIRKGSISDTLSLDIWKGDKVYLKVESKAEYIEDFLTRLSSFLLLDKKELKDYDERLLMGFGVEYGWPSESKVDEELFTGVVKDGKYSYLQTEEFIKGCKNEVPNELRWTVWEMGSGSQYLRTVGRYEDYLKRSEELDDSIKAEIETDIRRSLPEYMAYQTRDGLSRLRNVLLAYSFKSKSGYCQSLNIITAILLIYCSEEVSFWLLETLCTKILPDYHSRTMHGALIDGLVIEMLLEEYLPDLSRRMRRRKISLRGHLLPFMISAFTTKLALKDIPLFFDCLFTEGASFLMSFVLLVVDRCKGDLEVSRADEEVHEIFRRYFEEIHSDGLFRTFITGTNTISISNSRISDSRRQKRLEALNIIADQYKREKIGNIRRKLQSTKEGMKEEDLKKLYNRYWEVNMRKKEGLGDELDLDCFIEFFKYILIRPIDRVNKYLREIFDEWKENGQVSFEKIVFGIIELKNSEHIKDENLDVITALVRDY
eukprot:GHVP01012916.1.p1 GENE.GHVP01012916.1~~GHVP01012916.1.p1  ORF type:complete len:802 (+),score=129.84 GHVP01012916.1:137-2542(+)